MVINTVWNFEAAMPCMPLLLAKATVWPGLAIVCCGVGGVRHVPASANICHVSPVAAACALDTTFASQVPCTATFVTLACVGVWILSPSSGGEPIHLVGQLVDLH